MKRLLPDPNPFSDVNNELTTPMLRDACYRRERCGAKATFSWAPFSNLAPPDSLLPVQYYDLIRQPNHLNGEFRLVAALLVDAICCYRKYAKARDLKQRRLFNEVHYWFYSRNQRGLFAFEPVCDVLGLEAHSVRNALNLVRSTRLKLRRQSGHPAIGPVSTENSIRDDRARLIRYCSGRSTRSSHADLVLSDRVRAPQ